MTPAKFIRTTIAEREALGEKLAKKRNSLHIDIKDAERATRIPAKHLKNIEAGNYSKLPPKVYTKGFIQNYASFLGLSPKKILAMYEKEQGLEQRVKGAKGNKKNVKPALKTPRMVVTPKKLLLFGSAMAVLGILFFIGWQIKILTAPPALSVKFPGDNLTVASDYVYVEGQTDREADVYINDVKIGTDDNGVFKERVSLQNGVNILDITAKNKMNRATNVERKIMANLSNAPVAVDRTLYPVEAKIVVGPHPVTLDIVRDGEKLNIAKVMLPGSTQVFYAKNDIVLSTNNGGSTRVILNDKDLGLLGKEGQAVKDKKFSK